ncbi:MAG: type II toxin-antitoxin system ParD family antitoxin [Planctomycetes bacterium]|nr:type II toxin-antitoxin system ParD family antitoxin [Planctomycetota bacterium]
MNISVTRQNQEFIANLVKGGRYASASEVVRDAIRLLEDREERRRAWAKHAKVLLKDAEADVAEGQTRNLDDVRNMLLGDIEPLSIQMRRPNAKKIASRKRTRSVNAKFATKP